MVAFFRFVMKHFLANEKKKSLLGVCFLFFKGLNVWIFFVFCLSGPGGIPPRGLLGDGPNDPRGGTLLSVTGEVIEPR